MHAAHVNEAAIRAFRHNFEALVRNETGMIPEADITPVPELPSMADWASEAFQPELLKQVVVIKLNGGLGTSMGLQKAKSLLPVRGGDTFLDLMADQVLRLRKQYGVPVRLLLMNSFSTSEDTLAYLSRYKDSGLADANEVELMQNQVPKIDAATLTPVSWSQDPELEWCPPGHGDLYPALVGSGWLDRLLSEGVKYAFVSNSDNLGAVLDPALLRHFAESGAPFLMEVTRRTAADRKGGHLAARKSNGRLLLREVAQCPDADLDEFQDIDVHRYFNTNSLWLRLDALKEALEANDGVLPLPMIRNKKTVDPRDKNSTPVIQLEVAMGAAIECFEGARAVEVPRSRFAPVKTTSDLLGLRSDAYEIGEDGSVRLRAERNGQPPVIVLDDRYKLVDALDELGAVPSLLGSIKLQVMGRVCFDENVILEGEVTISGGEGEVKRVASGVYCDHSL